MVGQPKILLLPIEKPYHRFGPGLDMEFLVHGMDMRPDGTHANIQLLSDFLVEKSFGQAAENLVLPLRQLAQLVRAFF